MTSKDRLLSYGPSLLLIFGIVGSLTNLALALFMLGLALLSFGMDQSENAIMALSLGITFLGLAILGIPLIYWAIRSLQGEPIPSVNENRHWILALFLYPIALGIGYASIESMRIPGLFGPIANFAAAAAPVILTISLVRLNGPSLRLTRSWWHFLAGLWLVPPIVFAIELLALIPVLITLGIGLLSSDSGRTLIMQFSQVDLYNMPQVEQLAQGLVREPLVVLLLFLLFSVLVPLIEEGVKTIVVWPLLPRRISPAEGFLGGAIGGAGFALFESLFLAQQAGLWFASMLGRTGTSFIHALATGITCWGLTKSIQKQEFRWSVLGYGTAVVLHGVWNAAALGIGFSTISNPLDSMAAAGEVSGPLIVVGVGILLTFTVLALIALVALMRGIWQKNQKEALPSKRFD
jgi:RsiW-degrading membrane proteinase PrsW (M82 family)